MNARVSGPIAKRTRRSLFTLPTAISEEATAVTAHSSAPATANSSAPATASRIWSSSAGGVGTSSQVVPDVHLVKRTSFGLADAELDLARSVGAEVYLERQLAYESLDDSAIEAQVAQTAPSVAASPGQLRELQRGEIVRDLMTATLVRMFYSPRQLFEVMVDFWTNHFNVYLNDGAAIYLKPVDDREVVRPHALGRFRDLLQASAKSPAMLYYLDNYVNTAAGPNENYSRELMELHTLGVDGGFTQDDVQEVARCFTGWTIDRRTGGFAFVPPLHSSGSKVVLGQQILASGVQEGEQVLDLLASHPSTATFLATKLCRRFVSDDPPSSLVNDVAATFRQTDGDIRAVLRTILTSSEFFGAVDQKVQRPLEYVGAVVRSLGVRFGPRGGRSLFDLVTALAQQPYQWPAPNGYPDAAGAWASTNALLARWNFGVALAFGEVPDLDYDLDGLLAPLPDAPTAGELVSRLVDGVLHRPIAQGDRNTLIRFATRGGSESQTLAGAELREAAAGVVALILDSPYFQLR